MADCSEGCSAVLRTPEDREMHRKSLYKRHQLTSWKETYRQRCAERLRASRDNVLARFREGLSAAHGLSCPDTSRDECQEEIEKNLHRVMGEEWEQLRGELGLPSLPVFTAEGRKRRRTDSLNSSEREKKVPMLMEHEQSMDSDDEFTSTPPLVNWRESCLGDDEYDTDLDHVLYTIDEVTQELLKEERTILDQYEESVQFSEAALNAVIDTISEEPVVCPICLKHVLHQNKHIVFCACGLRIDTAQDGITLHYVRQQLQDGSTLHSKLCSVPPVFAVEEVVNGLQNLVMNCPVCDFLYIVL